MAAVVMVVSITTATDWCTRRSTRLKRTSCGAGTGRVAGSSVSVNGFVLASVGLADPPVDVIVAGALPVAGHDGVGELDRAQPFRALVAVHRRDVHPYRPAVIVRNRLAHHSQRDDHVGAPAL